jgi:hypothetical protein
VINMTTVEVRLTHKDLDLIEGGSQVAVEAGGTWVHVYRHGDELSDHTRLGAILVPLTVERLSEIRAEGSGRWWPNFSDVCIDITVVQP